MPKPEPSKRKHVTSSDAPSVRLAVCDDGMPSKKSRYPIALNPCSGPLVRLAHVPGAQGDNVLLGQRGVEQLVTESRPGLLISYFYIKGWLERQSQYAYRDWVMDSGAFSAYQSGSAINLQEFTDKCTELLATDPTLTEVFALDVIGDWKASVKNAEYMWSRGVPAIPTFHFGEPWELLKEFARDYPKIALGGCVGKPVKARWDWIAQCFARVWPKKVHGFGLSSEKLVMGFPFHSVDSTDWEIKPCKFGTWRAFSHSGSTAYLNVRGSKQNLRCEVEWYLDLERRARARWKKEMVKLESTDAPCVRLAADANSGGGARLVGALAPPAVRLVGSRGGGGQERLDSGLNKPQEEE